MENGDAEAKQKHNILQFQMKIEPLFKNMAVSYDRSGHRPKMLK